MPQAQRDVRDKNLVSPVSPLCAAYEIYFTGVQGAEVPTGLRLAWRS